MPSWFWIGLWVAVIVVVGVLYLRERRSGRVSAEVDRHQHEATREAEANRARFGPNGPNQTWGG